MKSAEDEFVSEFSIVIDYEKIPASVWQSVRNTKGSKDRWGRLTYASRDRIIWCRTFA